MNILHTLYKKIYHGGLRKINGRMHLSAGVITGVVSGAILYHNIEPTIYYTIGCAIGSILPDIDSPKSIISRFCRPIAILVNHYCGHRGLTHAPLIPLIFSIILQLKVIKASDLSYCLFYGLMSGCVLHLVQDICTMSGIPLLYPFSKKKTSLMGIKSGDPGNIPTTILILLIWNLGLYYRNAMLLTAFDWIVNIGSKSPNTITELVGNLKDSNIICEITDSIGKIWNIIV